MVLQRNEWIQEHFVLHQKWLESLKMDLVNEVNAFEHKVAAAMQVFEQKFHNVLQDQQNHRQMCRICNIWFRD